MGSIIALPNNYVVVDVETTGLDYRWDDIIEIAALKVRDGVIAEKYEQLVSIGYSVPAYITELTGITSEMLDNAPDISEAIAAFDLFIGNDIIIGHNINFDMHFLMESYRKNLGKELPNVYVDTLRIARRVFSDLPHHRLSDIAEHLGHDYEGAHRAGADCIITHNCYQSIRKGILSESSEEDFIKRCKRHSHAIKAKDIKATTDEFDIDHPLYQKTVVFTGALSKMTRVEAMQIVANCGGICGSGVTKSTNYLVIGTSDFISATEGKKTSKMVKAENLRAQGYDIATISEETFLDYIENT